MKSALERIKDISFWNEYQSEKNPPIDIVKDIFGNPLEVNNIHHEIKFLLKAFREMREIAVALSDLSCRGHDSEEGAECCDCPTLPLDHVDKRFEEKMSK